MPGFRTHSGRRGFTLLEVLVTITIIGMIAMMVMPTVSDDSRLRLMAATAVVTSDIEYAQVLTITRPEEAVVVRFDPPNNRYWLALAADPDTPINREDTGAPYLVVLGAGRASSAAGVTFTLDQVTNNILAFNAQGGVEDFITQPSITLDLAGRWTRIDIAPSTGTISETSGP